MKTQKVYPDKVYTSLARCCRYARVLPGYAQPVFQEFDGLMFQRIGFAPGPEKLGDTWLSYRRRVAK